MKSILSTITGISPLLHHAFPMVAIDGLEKMEPRQQADYARYRHPDSGASYVPGVNVQSGIVVAAAYSKGKGRSSLQKIAAAAIFVNETYLPITPDDWTVDSRPVVIRATRGRVIRHRPRFDKWSITFTIEYDEILLEQKQVRRIVDDLGQRVGLLDFRPAMRGPFGRFMVTRWDPSDNAVGARLREKELA